MTSPLLISLPVHERPDIVAGQLQNIRHFAPDSLVCLHVSPEYQGEMDVFTALTRQPGVFVNPDRLVTQRGCGLMHVHISNFAYVRSLGERFLKIVLFSSNELLIRHGLEAHTSRHAVGTQVEMYDPQTDWHLFHRNVQKLPPMQALLADLWLPHMFGGQAEGQFYSDDLFAEIAALYRRHFSLAPCGFESEEIIPQTITVALAGNESTFMPPVTFQNYCHAVDITPDMVEKIRRGTGYIFAHRHPRMLRSPHIGVQNLRTIFSVKRVPREHCAIRDYIYGLEQT